MPVSPTLLPNHDIWAAINGATNLAVESIETQINALCESKRMDLTRLALQVRGFIEVEDNLSAVTPRLEWRIVVRDSPDSQPLAGSNISQDVIGFERKWESIP
jgi:hypothetical protein